MSLAETVEQACQRAAREVLLMHAPQCPHDLPPPTALEAERALVGGLLEGRLATTQLRAADFYIRFHQAVIVAVEATGERNPSLARVVLGLRAQGLDNDLVASEELVRLRDAAPVVPDVPRLLAEITDAARRRRLIELLQRAEAALRMGTAGTDAVVKRLRDRL